MSTDGERGAVAEGGEVGERGSEACRGTDRGERGSAWASGERGVGVAPGEAASLGASSTADDGRSQSPRKNSHERPPDHSSTSLIVPSCHACVAGAAPSGPSSPTTSRSTDPSVGRKNVNSSTVERTKHAARLSAGSSRSRPDELRECAPNTSTHGRGAIEASADAGWSDHNHAGHSYTGHNYMGHNYINTTI